MLLAIDTATQVMSLALYDGRALLAEQTWHTANHHTADLAPAVRALLARAGAGVDALTLLGVSTGPGSYSGLRIGVALAKGLAAARGLPLVGISAPDTLAAAVPQAGATLFTLLQAGRGRLICGQYRWRAAARRWVSKGEPELLDWAGVLAAIATVDGAVLVTGEVDEAGSTQLSTAAHVTLVPAALRLRRAGFLAQEAWTRYHDAADKATFAADKLLPVYIKTRDIP